MAHDQKNPLLASLLHDGGRAATAYALLAFAVVGVAGAGGSLDFAFLIGGLVGGVLLPSAQQYLDYTKSPTLTGIPSKNSIHDVATYQPVWLPYFIHRDEWVAVWVTVLLVLIVLTAHHYSRIVYWRWSKTGTCRCGGHCSCVDR